MKLLLPHPIYSLWNTLTDIDSTVGPFGGYEMKDRESGGGGEAGAALPEGGKLKRPSTAVSPSALEASRAATLSAKMEVSQMVVKPLGATFPGSDRVRLAHTFTRGADGCVGSRFEQTGPKLGRGEHREQQRLAVPCTPPWGKVLELSVWVFSLLTPSKLVQAPSGTGASFTGAFIKMSPLISQLWDAPT